MRMRTLLIAFVASLMLVWPATDGFSQVKTPSAGALPRVYDETANPNTLIDEALAKAGREGKNVVCQVGGNWCVWCLRFARFITDDADISAFVNDHFVYAHINYDPSKPAQGEDTQRMLGRLGNPVRFGFPVLVVLAADGTVLHIQDSSYLEEGSSYDKRKVMRFFMNWSREATEGVKD
jgi:hypothetical protein